MTNSIYDMEHFVNRENELQFITERIQALETNIPLRPQFIEFYGVGGIGKTTILRKIHAQCSIRNMYPLWTDASQNPTQIISELMQQIRAFGITLSPQMTSDLLDQSIGATRALLRLGPTVFLIDSLDAENEDYLNWIKNLLHHFTDSSKLFFIIASKHAISFNGTMAIARKLKIFPLQPFSREYCQAYVTKHMPDCTLEKHRLIYKWTGGYPLAVEKMLQTTDEEKLDLSNETDLKKLLTTVSAYVINRGILANIPQDHENFRWYQTMLSLFSVPRRFNLSLMQKLTERFAQPYTLSSPLAYLDLPRRLSHKANVLSWNQSKAGFCMDLAIRPIFYTKLQLEDFEQYLRIHEYLAQVNSRLALEVSGTDRIRYLLEHLYHIACSAKDVTTLQTTVEKTMKQVLEESIDSLQFFQEEYKKDTELQDELGAHIHRYTPLALLNQHFAESYWQSGSAALQIDSRVFHFHHFFSNILNNPTLAHDDIILLCIKSIQRTKQQESTLVCSKLYSELVEDLEIQEKLQQQHESILSLLLTSHNAHS